MLRPRLCAKLVRACLPGRVGAGPTPRECPRGVGLAVVMVRISSTAPLTASDTKMFPCPSTATPTGRKSDVDEPMLETTPVATAIFRTTLLR